MARQSKEYTQFVKLTDTLLAVPRATLQKRVEEHRRQASENPNRRGPKRKGVTPSAEHRDDAEAS